MEKLIKSLMSKVGETHTVEIHPHIDPLLKLKSIIQDSGKPDMHISEIKKTGLSTNIIDMAPKDKKNRVSAASIDEHIKSLPKTKVNLKIHPYDNWQGQQQHRPNPEVIVSAELHPSEHSKMTPEVANLWERMSHRQHDWSKDGKASLSNQFGWVRVDPHTNKNTKSEESKPQPEDEEHKHWHLDEIQSDFQNPKKIENKDKETGRQELDDKIDIEKHPEYADHAEAIFDQMTTPGHPLNEVYQGLRDDAEAEHPYDNEDEDDSHRDNVVDNLHDEMVRNHVNGMVTEQLKEKDPNFFKKTPNEKAPEERAKLLEHLSHGHEDPQHALHSAINAFARQQGVESTSIDMPEDQARKSALHTGASHLRSRPEEWVDSKAPLSYKHEALQEKIKNGEAASTESKDKLWDKEGKALIEDHSDDPDFSSALKKVGGEKGIKELVGIAHHQGEGPMFEGQHGDWDATTHHSPEFKKKLKNLSDDEKNALSSVILKYQGKVHDTLPTEGIDRDYNDRQRSEQNERIARWEEASRRMQDDKTKVKELPIHQINTYNKRPKKLGFKPVDKDELLGAHPKDKAKQVQYSKLHKKLNIIKTLLKRAMEK